MTPRRVCNGCAERPGSVIGPPPLIPAKIMSIVMTIVIFFAHTTFAEGAASMGRNPTPWSAGVRTIKASEFKARCLKLMDEIAANGEEIVITKHGRPVSRLVPYRERPETLFGVDRGRFEIVGDIGDPIDVEWEAETGRGSDERP